nr:DUF1127 domain-containing protein [Pseudaestuariivita rosea]
MSEVRAARGGVFENTKAGLAGLVQRYARYKLYKTTLAELKSLTNRELSDLGLNRTMLRRVAYEAVYDR